MSSRRDRKFLIIMLLLEHGPMTRNELSERSGIDPNKVGAAVKQLRSTTPFNLLYICDHRRSKFSRNYPMEVLDVNLTGKPMADEPRPEVSSRTLRHRAAVAAGRIRLRADRQSGEPIHG